MFSNATPWRILTILFLMVVPSAAQDLSVSAGRLLTSPAVETLLMVAGGVFLILSVLTMGSGLAEFLCFLCFTLLFVGRYLQGEDPWVPLGLLVVGVGCLLAEVFVLPGFGICGILGLLALGAMTVLVAGSTAMGLIIFMVTTFCSVAAGFLAVRLLPTNRFTQRMFILKAPEPGPEAPPAQLPYTPAVGEEGVASSSLRPHGYAMFGAERLDVVTENEFVQKGQAVKVVRIEGLRVVVRSLPSPSELHQGG